MNNELRRVLGESQEPQEVVETTRPVPVYMCPHCKVEIHEKHQSTPDGGNTWFHSDCKGPIIWPPKSIREETAKQKREKTGPWGPGGFLYGQE